MRGHVRTHPVSLCAAYTTTAPPPTCTARPSDIPSLQPAIPGAKFGTARVPPRLPRPCRCVSATGPAALRHKAKAVRLERAVRWRPGANGCSQRTHTLQREPQLPDAVPDAAAAARAFSPSCPYPPPKPTAPPLPAADREAERGVARHPRRALRGRPGEMIVSSPRWGTRARRPRPRPRPPGR